MLNQPIPKLYLEKFHSDETEQKFHQEFVKSKKVTWPFKAETYGAWFS